ncbi:MAG TPA: sigma-70 family RNA polymerase sigma factor [Polyangia bacterium]|nr:sigma-70 family RNA polymerase sigma factor [Polyangia bacterium]
MDNNEVIRLVELAQRGDRGALEDVVRAAQDDVFHLALRMLGDPEDARDACQEVLVRIVTKLGSFRGESQFRTWVYSVATHALLNFRKEMRRPRRRSTRGMLLCLDRPHRLAYILGEILELPGEEAAAILGRH